MYQYVVMAAMSFIGSAMAESAKSKGVQAGVNAQSLTDSSRSKAAGTEAVLEGKRSVEHSEQTGRRALQLKGAAQAAADSSNVGGVSVAAKINDIQLQADQAIQIARDSAETRRKLVGMANREAFKANLYTAQNYEPQSLGKLAAGAAISAGVSYLGSEYGGQLFDSGTGGGK
jgi:hypothetical protein